MIFSRIAKAALSRFRSSLQLRALLYTVSLTGSALIILGGVLSVNIGNGLFNTRTAHAKTESDRAAYAISRLFSNDTGDSTWELNQTLDSVVNELESIGVSQSRLVYFKNHSSQPNSDALISVQSETLDIGLITPKFEAQVNSSTALQTQTIQIEDNGQSVPAVLTGQRVTIPGGHEYDLFLVYDMLNEQQNLLFVQRVLTFGGFSTMLIIGLGSFLVTNRLVKPMRFAAETSELMASGDLSRRLPVRGTDDVAVLANAFNHMAQSLEDKIEALKRVSQMQQRFVSDVSHELRTPLTSMRLSADMIYENRDSLPAESRRAAEILFATVDRFDRLLSDLLEISRYDAASVTPAFEVRDLNGIVGASLTAIQQLADSKGVYLDAEVPSGPIRAEVDSRRIDRILNNLLTNAIEHGEGKPVKIRIAQNEKAVAVTVSDSGIGMTKNELGQVFERFWRADPSRKRTTGGTGLGLAISLEDALAHNGRLDVTAEVGVGSCFRLTLPKRQEFTEYESPLPLIVEKN